MSITLKVAYSIAEYILSLSNNQTLLAETKTAKALMLSPFYAVLIKLVYKTY